MSAQNSDKDEVPVKCRASACMEFCIGSPREICRRHHRRSLVREIRTYCWFHFSIGILFLSFLLVIIHGLAIFILGMLPQSVFSYVLMPAMTIMPFVLQFVKALKNIEPISQDIALLFATLMYKVRDPYPTLTSSWLTLFSWQLFSTYIGIQIFLSLLEDDDLYLQFLFSGVLLHGLLLNSNLDWQIFIVLIFPVVQLYGQYSAYKRTDIKRKVIISSILIAVGFVLSTFPKPLDEMDYFIVNVYIGCTASKFVDELEHQIFGHERENQSKFTDGSTKDK